MILRATPVRWRAFPLRCRLVFFHIDVSKPCECCTFGTLKCNICNVLLLQVLPPTLCRRKFIRTKHCWIHLDLLWLAEHGDFSWSVCSHCSLLRIVVGFIGWLLLLILLLLFALLLLPTWLVSRLLVFSWLSRECLTGWASRLNGDG